MPPAPTVTQIKSLYAATISASQRFTSYNFHNYFIRRTNENFQPILSAIEPSAGASSSIDPTTLAKFYEHRSEELKVIQRAAEVNRLFQGPKLVVEHATPITGGGGSGAEASAGGGGQPV